MRHFLYIVFGIFFLTGCDQVSEFYYSGSVRAVTLCINSLESDKKLLSADTIKATCLKKHSKILDDDILGDDTKAVINFQEEYLVVARIEGKNKSETEVITSLKISAVFYDENGKKHRVSDTADFWIEPKRSINNESIFIEHSFPKEFKDYGWCQDDDENENPVSCKYWAVDEIRGLTV